MAIRVLIVDDAPFIREVLRDIIEPSGFELVGEAENGEQAVFLANQLKPDVVLMDLVMPIKSGIEATKEIVASIPEVKVIACSTLDQESMMLNAVEAGCCNYIVKPFKAKDLIEVIEASVKRKE